MLPGESLDGAGRVCIHLFVQDPHGPNTASMVMHPVFNEDGTQVKQVVDCKQARGRLACDPKRLTAAVTRNNITTVTQRTDDPRAVTCPKCKASEDYQKLMAKIENPSHE